MACLSLICWLIRDWPESMTAERARAGVDSRPRVVLVHGFNDRSSGGRNIDALYGPLTKRGYDVDCDSSDYGYTSLCGVRVGLESEAWVNGRRMKLGERMADAFSTAHIIATYSNGGNYAMQVLNRYDHIMRWPKLVVHFSPAMRRDVNVPPSVRQMVVCHSRDDRTVSWGAWFTSWFAKGWGRSGALGHKPADQRVINLDRTGKGIRDHGDWFTGHHLHWSADTIHEAYECAFPS